MHNAPSVSFPVGRSRFPGWIVASVALLAAVVWVGWVMQTQPEPLLRWALGGVWAASVALAVQGWRQRPRGMLHWDGSVWRWAPQQGPEVPGQLTCALDLQSRLWVSHRTRRGPVRWFWLSRSDDASAWNDLRRALFARQDDRRGDALAGPTGSKPAALSKQGSTERRPSSHRTR